jgi:hypothetical protein
MWRVYLRLFQEDEREGIPVVEVWRDDSGKPV